MIIGIIILLLSVFFCEISFAQKYSDKIIINPKIKKQFKYRDTCVAVFDAFKDCRCFLDTAKKTIDIEAGYFGSSGSEYLHFRINIDLQIKAEHIYDGDLVPSNVKDPFPPFIIKKIFIETDKNLFTKNNQGFLLKYRFGENRPSTNLEYPDKTNEFTGFINCHHLTVNQIEYKLSAIDSLNLITTFLKSKQLYRTLKKLNLKKVNIISGYLQEWKKHVPGYKLLDYQQLLQTKKNVLSVVILPNHGVLKGSKIVTWRYWKNGKRLEYFGSYYYQKFEKKWILLNSFMFNVNTHKSFLIR